MPKIKFPISEMKDAGEVKEKLKKKNINCDVTIEQDYGIITAEFEGEEVDEKKIRSALDE